MDLEQAGKPVFVKPEYDPAPVGRIRANECPISSALIVRYELQVGSVRANGGYVCRYPGHKNITIHCEHQVLAVRRPVLLDRDVETEWSDLEQITPIDTGGEESRSARLTVIG